MHGMKRGKSKSIIVQLVKHAGVNSEFNKFFFVFFFFFQLFIYSEKFVVKMLFKVDSGAGNTAAEINDNSTCK